MKMTEKEAEARFGKDAIKKLIDMPAEPTSRYIYPAFEPQHVGMAEFEAGPVLVEGGILRAYYFQPENADDWEFGKMNGIEYGEIEYIEFEENV